MTTDHGQRKSLFLATALALAAFIPALEPELLADGKPRPVRIMTRNLYLGADLGPASAARTLPGLALAASAIWQQVLATDFPERAEALAVEIREADPILIGLQEAALWRTGAPDGPPIFGDSPATDVVFDFVEILLEKVEALGVSYEVLVVQQELDLELPTVLGLDTRLTLRDVILARADLAAKELALSNPRSANFASTLSIPVLGGAGSIAVRRGWTAVDVVAKRRSFRLVSTHLEAASNFFRTAQALELLAGPLATSSPVVLIGDLNSAPDDPVFTEPASPFNTTNPFDLLTMRGLLDTWPLVNPLEPGFTCCNAKDLLNEDPTLSRRIDHLLVSPGVATYRSKVIGTDADNRTSSGLWPSDHAGVIAALAP